ncbi:cadherin-like domain-containing protein [Loktanella sp. DJP18]|uniref:cadherin-like domain-containing protein n=1 Tax=Loktanella sp. DJP18 TaxID=3409788 RepID=UPI003BB53257
MLRDLLKADEIQSGVSAQEIVDIAISNIGIDWTIDGCTDFVWGVSNLAGAPFFDLKDNTIGGDPAQPQDITYIVPHSPGIKSGTDDVAGDGWKSIFVGTSASAMTAALRPGDVVRVYTAGNAAEESLLPGGGYGAHSFVVASVTEAGVEVVDNWNTAGIVRHSLDDITAAFAPGGQFEAAFVSRLDDVYIAATFENDLGGNGFGSFSGLVDSGGSHSTPVDGGGTPRSISLRDSFQLNQTESGPQWYSKLVPLSDSNFLAVWRSTDAPGGTYARLMNSDGPLTDEIAVSERDSDFGLFKLTSGDIALVHTSAEYFRPVVYITMIRLDEETAQISADTVSTRIDSDGTMGIDRLNVNDQVSLGLQDGGLTLILTETTEEDFIFLKFDQDGALEIEARLDLKVQKTSDIPNGFLIATELSSGDLMLLWGEATGDPFDHDPVRYYAQTLSILGEPVGDPVLITDKGARFAIGLEVLNMEDGTLFVSWRERDPDTTTYTLSGKFINSDGSMVPGPPALSIDNVGGEPSLEVIDGGVLLFYGQREAGFGSVITQKAAFYGADGTVAQVSDDVGVQFGQRPDLIRLETGEFVVASEFRRTEQLPGEDSFDLIEVGVSVFSISTSDGPNDPPVASGDTHKTYSTLDSIPLANLFALTDPDGADDIVSIEISDNTPGSDGGVFLSNPLFGSPFIVTRPMSEPYRINITPEDLKYWFYQPNTFGTNAIQIEATDREGNVSNPLIVNLSFTDETSSIGSAPIITGPTLIELDAQGSGGITSIIFDSSVINVSDVDSDVSYIRFYDTTPGEDGGYLALDGVRITGTFQDVGLNGLDRISYVAGQNQGFNDIAIEAFDAEGNDSNDLLVRINVIEPAPENRAPDVAPRMLPGVIERGQAVRLDQLFAVSDPDGNSDISSIRVSVDQNAILRLDDSETVRTVFNFDEFGRLTVVPIGQASQFTVEASDGLLSDTASLTLSVGELQYANNLELEYFSRQSAYGDGPVAQIGENGIVGHNGQILIDGWTVKHEFVQNTFRAIVLEKAGYAPVLAFRGTDAIISDWIENGPIDGVGYREIKAAWDDNIRSSDGGPGFHDWLVENRNASISGHSQGGSQAQLAIEFMIGENVRPTGYLTTFNTAGINKGSDATDYGSLQGVVHFVSAGDIVSQVGNRFTPGEVVYYDMDSVAPDGNATDLLARAHTGHWSQPELYSRAWVNDVPVLDEYPEIYYAATPNTTEVLGSPFFSHGAIRSGVDSEYHQLYSLMLGAAFASGPGAVVAVPFVTALFANRASTEETRSTAGNLLSSLIETAGVLGQNAKNVLQWLENDADNQIASIANLSDSTSLAEVVAADRVIYQVNESFVPFDVPNGQDALFVGQVDNLNGLRISSFDSRSAFLIQDPNINFQNINIRKGSAIIEIDEDLDGIVDATITLEGNFRLASFTGTQTGYGLELNYLGNAIPEAIKDAFTTSESTAFITRDVLLNDTDGDGDELNIVGLDLTGTLGIVTDNGDGTFGYDPNGAFDSLLNGETAADTFVYLVSDGTETVCGEVTITITGEGTPASILNPINGTTGSDSIVGTDQADDIDAMSGDDVVASRGGADIISLGSGADILVGSASDHFGDTVRDFNGQDSIIFEGVRFARSDMTVSGDPTVLGIDIDQDGNADGSMTLLGDFSSGDFMAVAFEEDTTLSFETFLPELQERQAVDPELVNGIINQNFLKGDGSTDFKVTLRDMGFAGYNNVVGVYEINASGNIVDARILFKNANSDKVAETGITDVEADNKLGFFIVQDAALWATTLVSTDTLSFINSSGAAATIADGKDISIAVNGTAVDEMVFHSFAEDMNSDGVQHALSGVDVGGESISIGFEDLTGGGDLDYEDVVFRVELVDNFVFV